MPSWITHLITANKIAEKLKIEEDKKSEFIFGNIMPDILNGFNVKIENPLSYYETHFAKKVEINGITLPIPDIDRFKEEYKDILKSNILICGFFTHLLTDYFWNEYVYKNYFEIYDKEQRIVKVKYRNGKKRILSWNEAVQEKQKDFALFAQSLRNKIDYTIPINVDKILLDSKAIKEFSYTKKNIEKTIIYLQSIKERIIPNTDYEIFTQSILDEKFEESISFIIEKLQQNNKEGIRLQKYMADHGIASRRKCEEYILQGKVKVNGKIQSTLGIKIDPQTDKVEFNNKLITNEQEYVYILINKPIGYVTTVSDQFNRPTILDLIKGVKQRIVPVGRLDMYTSGALILTNDGDFIYKVTHPKHEIEKTYTVTLKGEIKQEAIEQLRNGVQIEDYVTKPAKVKILKIDKQKNISRLEIIIHEGKNRQVRKMCEAVRTKCNGIA